MFPEIEQFKKHLWRQSQHTNNHRHYTNDSGLFALTNTFDFPTLYGYDAL